MSEHFRCSPRVILDTWTYEMLADAHILLDCMAELDRKSAEASRGAC
jgi:hypothetical protein